MSRTRLPSTTIDDLVVSPLTTMLEVMRVIDRTGLEVALVCSTGGKLQAVVTDGDLRRAILSGKPLTTPIGEIGNNKFTAVPPSMDRSEALALMIERSFKSLPVVDAQGVLTDIHTLSGTLITTRCDSWAVVMAGGKGERLGELTAGTPKPMLPIGDRPILEHIVERLVSHGIRRIFLSVNHYGKMIEDHFGDGRRWMCKIEYLWEDKPLGTGGALALLPQVPTAPVVVMNGDLMTAINITNLLKFHRAGEFALTIALREHKIQVPFGVAELDGSRVTKLVEKPSLNYRINAGIYVVGLDALKLVPKDTMYPITELADVLLKNKMGVGAYHMQESWNDIGLPEEFARAQRTN